MNETKIKRSAKLERFSALYNESLLASSEEFERLEQNMSQYLGSYEIDGGEKASTVRNITYEIIESQVNSDIPTPKVDSICYSERRERNAHSIERLCASLKELLPFETLNELDERYTYIYGASVWYVEWDNEEEDGGVRVHCISPQNFICQAGITDVSEMEYCFLRFTTTKGALMRRYGISAAEAEMCECEFEYGEGTDSDTVRLVICFYKDDRGEIGKFVFSGDVVLSDVETYYRRKKKVCKICGEDIEGCNCAVGDFITVDVLDESYNNKRIPYYVPKSFPIVIRKNTMGAVGIFGGSDCERIRPQQQAINKVESRILQKLLRSGVTPIMPEGASITLSNAIFGQIIKTRPGESIDHYGKIDTTPDISQDILEADRLYDQAKRVLGISDALQGLDATTSESGYARQLKISRASSRLETKKRMKHLAYCKLYELIFKHYLAFADEPRRFAFRDTFGRIHFTEFNRYDFIEQDKAGNYYYDDSYLFSVDNNANTQYEIETLWEINLHNLERGTLGNPDEPMTLMRYWQLQDKAHFPHARENVEYFQDILNNQEITKGETTNE